MPVGSSRPNEKPSGLGRQASVPWMEEWAGFRVSVKKKTPYSDIFHILRGTGCLVVLAFTSSWRLAPRRRFWAEIPSLIEDDPINIPDVPNDSNDFVWDVGSKEVAEGVK